MTDAVTPADIDPVDRLTILAAALPGAVVRQRHIAAPFDADRLALRAANKAALQQRFGLRRDPAKLLFGVISRLSAQKGIDLVLAALPTLPFSTQPVVLSAGCAVCW